MRSAVSPAFKFDKSQSIGPWQGPRKSQQLQTTKRQANNGKLRKGKSRNKTTPRQSQNHPKTPRQRRLAIMQTRSM